MRAGDVWKPPVGLALTVFGAFDMDDEVIAAVAILILSHDMDFQRAVFRENLRVKHLVSFLPFRLFPHFIVKILQAQDML